MPVHHEVDHRDPIPIGAYLYYTRFNDGGLDCDLVGVPITLTRID